ncbi:hypothetical protein GCM10011357_06700 [Lacimicrobium alkaliphilum]|uniref:Penicillin-binding protein transpeptidase domain-containing protein n=1 Tax=Lacimicrobium alkaliphilum TaxID=1526571 RepID=A0ABQ1R083_9ALTE|nr:hypothetical protein GCM10011357_06700 [Lacimicrobium alkaliphilum]
MLSGVSQVAAQTPSDNAQQRVEARLQDAPFYQNVLKASALLPENMQQRSISCTLAQSEKNNPEYKSSRQSRLNEPGWEQRISADWDYFGETEPDTKVLVIDHRQQGDEMAYRYLANGHSQDTLYEPWSTSKVMAITGAISKARSQGVGARSLAGGYVPVADLITSIHTYQPFGKANGNSNAIATYMVNAAGRDYITGLFQGNWLKLSNSTVGLRGGYYVEIFNPGAPFWLDTESEKQAAMPILTANTADPGYRSYRCETCGLTGNKPMTTLAQAEWLKRLAVHERDKMTRHPNLTGEDVQTLFYGDGHSDSEHPHGGMIMGISRLIPHALSRALGGNVSSAKNVLDQHNEGNWRIFQKIGWGPSETRGKSEMAMLAHLCLPGVMGGREFTLAAHTGVEGDAEVRVNDAAKKMQRLLDLTMKTLLTMSQDK